MRHARVARTVWTLILYLTLSLKSVNATTVQTFTARSPQGLDCSALLEQAFDDAVGTVGYQKTDWRNFNDQLDDIVARLPSRETIRSILLRNGKIDTERAYHFWSQQFQNYADQILALDQKFPQYQNQIEASLDYFWTNFEPYIRPQNKQESILERDSPDSTMLALNHVKKFFGHIGELKAFLYYAIQGATVRQNVRVGDLKFPDGLTLDQKISSIIQINQKDVAESESISSSLQLAFPALFERNRHVDWIEALRRLKDIELDLVVTLPGSSEQIWVEVKSFGFPIKQSDLQRNESRIEQVMESVRRRVELRAFADQARHVKIDLFLPGGFSDARHELEAMNVRPIDGRFAP